MTVQTWDGAALATPAAADLGPSALPPAALALVEHQQQQQQQQPHP